MRIREWIIKNTSFTNEDLDVMKIGFKELGKLGAVIGSAGLIFAISYFSGTVDWLLGSVLLIGASFLFVVLITHVALGIGKEKIREDGKKVKVQNEDQRKCSGDLGV